MKNSRKKLIGIVMKNSGNKTLKVIYYYKKRHPVYNKIIKKRLIVFSHDEENKCKEGDKVLIIQTKPISKKKQWKVVSIINN